MTNKFVKYEIFVKQYLHAILDLRVSETTVNCLTHSLTLLLTHSITQVQTFLGNSADNYSDVLYLESLNGPLKSICRLKMDFLTETRI